MCYLCDKPFDLCTCTRIDYDNADAALRDVLDSQQAEDEAFGLRYLDDDPA